MAATRGSWGSQPAGFGRGCPHGCAGLSRGVRQAARCSSGVDLDIAPGEFVAMLGVSGTGKSTLLRARLAGLDREVHRRAERAGAGRGPRFQEPRLLPLAPGAGQRGPSGLRVPDAPARWPAGRWRRSA